MQRHIYSQISHCNAIFRHKHPKLSIKGPSDISFQYSALRCHRAPQFISQRCSSWRQRRQNVTSEPSTGSTVLPPPPSKKRRSLIDSLSQQPPKPQGTSSQISSPLQTSNNADTGKSSTTKSTPTTFLYENYNTVAQINKIVPWWSRSQTHLDEVVDATQQHIPDLLHYWTWIHELQSHPLRFSGWNSVLRPYIRPSLYSNNDYQLVSKTSAVAAAPAPPHPEEAIVDAIVDGGWRLKGLSKALLNAGHEYVAILGILVVLILVDDDFSTGYFGTFNFDAWIDSYAQSFLTKVNDACNIDKKINDFQLKIDHFENKMAEFDARYGDMAEFEAWRPLDAIERMNKSSESSSRSKFRTFQYQKSLPLDYRVFSWFRNVFWDDQMLEQYSYKVSQAQKALQYSAQAQRQNVPNPSDLISGAGEEAAKQLAHIQGIEKARDNALIEVENMRNSMLQDNKGRGLTSLQESLLKRELRRIAQEFDNQIAIDLDQYYASDGEQGSVATRALVENDPWNREILRRANAQQQREFTTALLHAKSSDSQTVATEEPKGVFNAFFKMFRPDDDANSDQALLEKHGVDTLHRAAALDSANGHEVDDDDYDGDDDDDDDIDDDDTDESIYERDEKLLFASLQNSNTPYSSRLTSDSGGTGSQQLIALENQRQRAQREQEMVEIERERARQAARFGKQLRAEVYGQHAPPRSNVVSVDQSQSAHTSGQVHRVIQPQGTSQRPEQPSDLRPEALPRYQSNPFALLAHRDAIEHQIHSEQQEAKLRNEQQRLDSEDAIVNSSVRSSNPQYSSRSLWGSFTSSISSRMSNYLSSSPSPNGSLEKDSISFVTPNSNVVDSKWDKISPPVASQAASSKDGPVESTENDDKLMDEREKRLRGGFLWRLRG